MTVEVIIIFHYKVTTLPPIIKPLPPNFFPRILRDALFSLLEFRENEGKWGGHPKDAIAWRSESFWDLGVGAGFCQPIRCGGWGGGGDFLLVVWVFFVNLQKCNVLEEIFEIFLII